MTGSEPTNLSNCLRYDMKTRRKIFVETLLVLLIVVSLTTVAARAQTTSPPKKNTTQSQKPRASPATPDLEPQAVELLKAVSEPFG